MNIYAKLMQARLQLQNTDLKKSGHNKFAGYKYFELGDFLPTVQKIFEQVGLCGVVSYTAELATLTISDGTDQIVITSPMGGANLKGCHEVQNIGAVETYQRRYLWVTALEIVEHDVLDATTGSDTVKKPEAVTPLAGALDHYTKEEQESLRWVAEQIEGLVAQGDLEKAKENVKQFKSQDKVALWSLLSSKTRSTLKKAA